MEMTKQMGSGDSAKSYNHILNTLQKSLEQGSTVEFLSLTDNSRYAEELQTHLNQLMPIITAQLNEDVKQCMPEKFECAKTIFTNLVEKLDCEDVLLQLIEEIQNAVDDVCCLCLVEGVWKTGIKLPRKRINSFAWGLDAINKYIHNIEADEEDRITNLLSELVPFHNAFIRHEVHNQEQKYLLLRFLVKLLGRPFACLNMQSNTEVRRIGQAIVEQIIHFRCDILGIPELSSWGRANDLNTIDSLSLATLYYSVFSEKVCWDKIPQIYDQIYVFQNMLPFISELLSHSEYEQVIPKGLNLLEASLDCVRGMKLPHTLLDIKHNNSLCKNLSGMIVFSQSETQRKFGLKLFHRYLLQFETYGRYLLIYNVTSILNHSGLIGFVVTVCKDMINEELNAHSNKSLCFAGPRLFAVLYKFCRLPQGDPIEMADEIVATLNLLRFLAIRDRNNRTGVQEYLNKCKNSYLEGLKKILVESRPYYESMIKEVNEAPPQSDVSVEVAGQVLEDLTSGDKLSALNSALTTIDVIESLLGRLNELIENA